MPRLSSQWRVMKLLSWYYQSFFNYLAHWIWCEALTNLIRKSQQSLCCLPLLGTISKASRYWDVFTILHCWKHSVKQVKCMVWGLRHRRTKGPGDTGTFNLTYRKQGFMGESEVVVYHQLLEPLKWIFLSLEILPSSARDVKYYKDFWSQSQI